MDYLKMLQDAGIVKRGHFRLRSGRHSSMYVNKDLIWQNPEIRSAIVNRLCERIVRATEYFSHRGAHNLNMQDIQITGPAAAASSWAAVVSDRLRVPYTYCEKETVPFCYYDSQVPPERDDDGHVKVWQSRMMYSRGFPEALDGAKVALVEDIVTTGSSVVKTMEALSECGAFSLFVACIWNRSGSDTIEFKENGKSAHVLVFPIINKRIEDYGSECPMCEKGIPLEDPKKR